MKKTYIIAEIGINHNGSLSIAKKLIDVAAVAGCDAVKFQKRNPEVCVPEHQKSIMRDTPWGMMTYLEYKYKIEFEKDEYDEIDRYCKQKNISWSASPWDLDSLDFLDQYDVPFIKIPSAMLTNQELIKKSAATGKKIILSTGMSTMKEVDQAVIWLISENADFALLHCNSAYPAPLEDLNLSCINTLKNKYQCEVGYSGHEFRLGTTVAAVYLGATILERHITLDRTMWGSDHLSSVEPQGLIKLVSGVRELELAYGDGVKRVTEGEKPSRKKLRGN
ncbi:MAG: N-acetylneuraminate synthase [Betaproteobacteria bacterium TMED156]|nr:MAG: N-acetylneuraminate synthase [Betaproteobacteria bacterium TMED156]